MRRKKTVDTVDIKVSRSGSKVETFTLANGNRAVSDALRAAGINKKESETIQVNGEEIDDLDYELEDGDRVVLIKNIEGGAC